MERFVKTFDALGANELYAILRARQDVFVVEQECAYPDIDGKDQAATHLWYADDAHPVAAYCRVFAKPDEPGTMVIGRVLTTARGTGLGGTLLHDAVGVAREMDPDATQIWLEAQRYAIGFYARGIPSGVRAVHGRWDRACGDAVGVGGAVKPGGPGLRPSQGDTTPRPG
ncbi:MAG: GNAT family N-acetyltransferase [Bifidobacterium sp.]|nr:GNAT family N-acetyltransferase [Bifidobacterium sp.]